MEFNLVGFLFWIFIITGLFCMIVGLWKKSFLPLVLSGVLFVLPMLYFWGAENAYKLLVFIPLIPFTIAYFIRKARIRSSF